MKKKKPNDYQTMVALWVWVDDTVANGDDDDDDGEDEWNIYGAVYCWKWWTAALHFYFPHTIGDILSIFFVETLAQTCSHYNNKQNTKKGEKIRIAYEILKTNVHNIFYACVVWLSGCCCVTYV